jgi:nucleotide-binding universal stress UspA family protein
MGSMYAPTIAVPYDECRDAAQEFLDNTVRQLRADGGVTVVPQLVEGDAGHALVMAAADADLVVVGTRGHNEMMATMLGSTSHHCVHHSLCAIAVIP